MKTRLIIAGGRDFTDYEMLRSEADKIQHDEVVSGCARGADRLGERYATERRKKLRQFPANWRRHGKAAGPIRNTEMANNAEALLAFWDERSRGTLNMINTARSKGLSVTVIKY